LAGRFKTENFNDFAEFEQLVVTSHKLGTAATPEEGAAKHNGDQSSTDM
jgi:hypothetical protein